MVDEKNYELNDDELTNVVGGQVVSFSESDFANTFGETPAQMLSDLEGLFAAIQANGTRSQKNAASTLKNVLENCQFNDSPLSITAYALDLIQIKGYVNKHSEFSVFNEKLAIVGNLLGA